MKKLKQILPLLLLLACSKISPTNELSETISQIERNLKTTIEMCTDARTDMLVSPRSFVDDTLVMVPSTDWTSGFFSGELWMMYELTSDPYWKEKAEEFTFPLENEKWNGKTHDIGFKMYCSFGRAWKDTNDPQYRDILIQSAKALADRFKPNVGCVRSWNHNAGSWDFPVIIDNMMNLELLFWAANETGNAMYREIAIKHAETTMQHHFRKDYSLYHVVDFDPETGAVQQKQLRPGYPDESAWARGQAWALYGFTMVYRETGDKIFLKQAENIATYILNHPNLPENLIPFWDLNAPNIPDEPYDASAAAIIGSALYELCTFSENRDVYLNAANKIFESLTSDQFFTGLQNYNGFLLQHSTGSKPEQLEVDVPLIYADYYFMEMIVRKSKLLKN